MKLSLANMLFNIYVGSWRSLVCFKHLENLIAKYDNELGDVKDDAVVSFWEDIKIKFKI